MKKISCIIPVYNAEKTLERCVESIVYGNEKDIEVILVEDFSKDNSWEICQDLQKRFDNVICYRNEKNKGVSCTRNKALQMANGEYALFVDSDDWVSVNYATELLARAEHYPEALIICGYLFCDYLSGKNTYYLWEKEEQSELVLGTEKAFEIVEKVLMQQLWNKIFRMDVIKNYHISFDESQNMGEDFQFVLDYIEAIKCEKCVIVNQPLYTYVRASNLSLMSQFGQEEWNNVLGRYERLKKICNANGELEEEQYNLIIEMLKKNYLYQIVHNTRLSKSECLKKIEQIMQDGNAYSHFVNQKKILYKEKIWHKKNQVETMLSKIKNSGNKNKKIDDTRN